MQYVTTILLIVLAVFALLVALFLVFAAVVGRRYHKIQGASRAVAAWAPSHEPARRIGKLSTRTHGNLEAPTAIIALHGLASSGAYYGENWAALAGDDTSLIVPDLLGFGDSIDRKRTADEHSIEHHVAAISETIDEAAPQAKELHIVAHSFGTIIALAYAREVLDRVASVTLISPPLHDSREEAERYIVARGRVTALFAVDRLSARIARAILCSRPIFARTVTRLAAPAMPSELARRTHMHSWASYIGTFRAFLDNRGWRSTMSLLAERGIPVRVVIGSRDFTIDREIISSLPTSPEREVTVLQDHGHQAPLTNPIGCVELVRTTIEKFRARGQASLDTLGEQLDGDTATAS